MKELIISLERAKELYPTSDNVMREIFETTFGKSEFEVDICKRINSLDDVEYINNKKISLPYPFPLDRTAFIKHINASVNLFHIAKAYNQGIEIDIHNTNQEKWFPYLLKDGEGWVMYCYSWFHCYDFPSELVYTERRLALDAYKKFPHIFQDWWGIKL